jgi:hypothetical protein
VIDVPLKLRKRLYDDVLVNYSLKLRPDQIRDLKKLKDAAGLIRTWIDKGIAEEFSKGEDPVSVAKQITALETEISMLSDDVEYKRARDTTQRGLEFYLKQRDFIQGNYDAYKRGDQHSPPELSFRNNSLFIVNCNMMDESRGYYAPGWTTQSLLDYLANNQIDIDNISVEHAQTIVTKMIDAYPAEVKVLEGYQKRIAQLQEVITALRRKLTEQT